MAWPGSGRRPSLGALAGAHEEDREDQAATPRRLFRDESGAMGEDAIALSDEMNRGLSLSEGEVVVQTPQ